MSRRGSAQLLLLLFFRSRKARVWTMGAVAAGLAAGGLIYSGGDFAPQTGLIQTLRQSAWQHALAGLPQQTSWPWTEKASNATPSVPRLGLSATLVKDIGSNQDEGASLEAIDPQPAQDPHLPQIKLGDVNVGDRITVTAADGSSRVYRVTGRKVVDPHLAETAPVASDNDKSLVTCLPLDPLLASSLRLVIQATKVDQVAPAEPSPEL
jgi:hypothetical protein